ncbi:MAG: hypothetical protein WCP01_07770 [Methylococcaceae bacterium]
MHELTESELYQALKYAKSIEEDDAKIMMSQFELDQPQLFQALFGIFTSIVADQNQDMAHLFMDLCFDVLCVYQKTFGDTPKSIDDPTWMEKQAILLEAEFAVLLQNRYVDEAKREGVQEHFSTYKENILQLGLVKFLNECIDEFAAEQVSRVPAIELTQAMILLVVKLFNDLYDKPARH